MEQAKLNRSIDMAGTFMPALMTLGVLLLILMITSFVLAPVPVELGPDGEPVVAKVDDTKMDVPPPWIFNQTWTRWVALATCLPLGLAMLAVGGMLIASTKAKTRDLHRVQAELAQLK